MAGNYAYELVLPKATTEENAVLQEIILTAGVLNLITIGFPLGCAGLAHAQILIEDHVLFPTNDNVSYAWDNTIFPILANYLIEDELPAMYIKGWNDDTSYQHTLTIGFNIVSEETESLALVNALRFMVLGI